MHVQGADKYAPSYRDCLPESSGTQWLHEKHRENRSVGSKQSFKQLNIRIWQRLIAGKNGKRSTLP